MLLIFVASSMSDPVPTGLESLSDKLLHFGGYLPLGVLLVRTFAKAKWSGVGRRSVVSAMIVGALYAASDELHQYFTPGREADPLDLLADCAGVALGAAGVWAWAIMRSARAG
jgi:VanZ family protein